MLGYGGLKPTRYFGSVLERLLVEGNQDTILDDETLTVVNITIITINPTYINQISF